MENSEEQFSVGCHVVVFGILESLVAGGLLYVWLFVNAWGERPVLTEIPYVIGTALVIQLVIGIMFWRGKITQRNTTSVGKVIIYCLLITVIIPVLIVLILNIVEWIRFL